MRLTMAIGATLLIALAPTSSSARESRSVGLSGDVARFFGPDAYPPEAMRKGEQGRVVARLTVGADGHVVDCRVTISSGSTALDVRTCVIAMGKVTFNPARNEAGRPIVSTYTLPVRWVLPIPVAEPRRSMNNVITLRVAADNHVESCTGSDNGRAVEKSNITVCAEYGGAEGSIVLRRMRSSTGPGPLVLTFQRIIQFPGDPPISEVHALAGHTVLMLRRAALDVLPDGKVSNQQIVEQTGWHGDADSPIDALPTYEGAAATTPIMVLMAISYARMP